MTSASIVPRASNTANGVRDQAGREASPRAIINSQSAKGAQKGVLARSFGLEAGKKIKVRKRHILVDTMGLLFSVVVHTADVQDHDGAFQCCVARDECFHSSNASSELQLTSVLPLAKMVSEQSIHSRQRSRAISSTAKVIAEFPFSTMSVMVSISSTLGWTENEGCECHSPR